MLSPAISTFLKCLLPSIWLCIICWSCHSSKKSTTTLTDDGKIAFTILQINDVYEIAPLEGGKVGGMARVASLYQQLKKENPNTFFVHGGDFLNPSLIGTMKYQGSRISGKQMVEAMNMAGVDLVVFGNHEFDLKPDELRERLNESTFEWLGSNVRFKEDGRLRRFAKETPDGLQDVPDTYHWDIRDADGTNISIGFFGATIASNPVEYVTYLNHEKITKHLSDLLKSNSDIVLGLTHLSIEEDKAVAALINGVPLIMGGHEHHHMKHKVGNTIIAKADANAKTAYVHYLTFDKKNENYKSR